MLPINPRNSGVWPLNAELSAVMGWEGFIRRGVYRSNQDDLLLIDRESRSTLPFVQGARKGLGAGKCASPYLVGIYQRETYILFYSHNMFREGVSAVEFAPAWSAATHSKLGHSDHW